MDFGFDGFLNKFEEHFGKGWTKALLVLIGITVASLCLAVIWRYLISPIVVFYNGNAEMIARVMTALAVVCAGAVWGLRIYDWFFARKIKRLGGYSRFLRVRIRKTEKLLEELREQERKDLARHGLSE